METGELKVEVPERLSSRWCGYCMLILPSYWSTPALHGFFPLISFSLVPFKEGSVVKSHACSTNPDTSPRGFCSSRPVPHPPFSSVPYGLLSTIPLFFLHACYSIRYGSIAQYAKTCKMEKTFVLCFFVSYSLQL